MLKYALAVALLALAGCDQSYQSPGQPVDPGTRAALLGALIANQPQPYYQQPYMMPVQQTRGFSCMQMGSMIGCN